MQHTREKTGQGRQQHQPEEKQFDERIVNIDRVARVVKGGRRFRFRALVVVGDNKGTVGVGIAKGADVTSAVTKATDTAKKNFVKLPVYKGTLPHEVQARVGGANILIKPAAPGTGLIAGGVVRVVLEVSGYHNALSKSLGSSNKINTAYATLAALQSMTPRSEWLTAKAPKPSKAAKLEKPAAESADKTDKSEKTEKPAAEKTTKEAAKTAKAEK